VRAGLPNQDSIGWLPASGSGDGLVVAVADGHGSARHCRSDVGATLAVAVALSLGQGVLASLSGTAGDPTHLAGELAGEITDAWVTAVGADLARRPFLSGEREALAAANPLLAYGTTLLLGVVVGDRALVLQIGDGDVLELTPGGVTRPVPADPRLFGGETTSLCLPDAARDFRLGHVRPEGGGPAALLLATDGFQNAYVDDEGFLSAGAAILACTEGGGIEAVDENLTSWLTEAGRHSGDDVSAVVVLLASSRLRGGPPRP
jgi:serine/threonine protein phosphatase PrpC